MGMGSWKKDIDEEENYEQEEKEEKEQEEAEDVEEEKLKVQNKEKKEKDEDGRRDEMGEDFIVTSRQFNVLFVSPDRLMD